MLRFVSLAPAFRCLRVHGQLVSRHLAVHKTAAVFSCTVRRCYSPRGVIGDVKLLTLDHGPVNERSNDDKQAFFCLHKVFRPHHETDCCHIISKLITGRKSTSVD
ncbi:hypothetical protein GBF38_009607 [Nibea albiflora]|uniref:Uncharacterized protein n=1 Tax=Nibea albiflora TaxID=240163 RepID=A0ACB7F8I9_NIBAL|nr:hypothetical protein GBF38_009607 [Nibea albiflora]